MGGRAATEAIIRGRCAVSVNDPGHPTPRGWLRVPLSEIAELGTGHTPSRKHPEYWGGDVPWIGIRDAGAHHGGVITHTAQHTNNLGLAKSAARLLPEGTVCLSRTASVGYVVMMGCPMATSQDFVTWTCGEALEPKFLMQALLAEGDDIRRFGEGSTHTTIYFPEVKAFHLDIPPKAEQRRIVAKIDRLSAKSSCVRDHLDQIPRLVEKYKQAILAAAASGDLTLKWREMAGLLPPKLGRLSDLTEVPIRNGLSIRGSDQPPGIRSLRLSALRTRTTNLGDVRYLQISASKASKYELCFEDILVSRGNGTKSLVGIASIVPKVEELTIFPDTAFRIRLGPRRSSRWLALIWNAPLIRQAYRTSRRPDTRGA